MTSVTGNLRKMPVEPGEDGQAAQYSLLIGDKKIPLNPLLGTHISLEYTGIINCVNCGRRPRRALIKATVFHA